MKYISGVGSLLPSLESSPIGLFLFEGAPPTVEEIEAEITVGDDAFRDTSIAQLTTKYTSSLVYSVTYDANQNMIGVFTNRDPVTMMLRLSPSDGSAVKPRFYREGTPTWFVLAPMRNGLQARCQTVMYGYIPDQMKVDPPLIKSDSVIYVSILAIND